MPKPAYIICSDTRLTDEKSKKLTFVNVFEKVMIEINDWKPPGKEIVPPEEHDPDAETKRAMIPFDCQLTSVWQISEAERGSVFENKISFRDEAGEEFFELLLPPTEFKKEETVFFHRVATNMRGFPPLPHVGIWQIVNSLRRIGDESAQWVSQGFPFLLEANNGYLEMVKLVKGEMGVAGDSHDQFINSK